MQNYVFGAEFSGLSEVGDVYAMTYAVQGGYQGYNQRATRFRPDGGIAWDHNAQQDLSGRGFQGVAATNDGIFYGNFRVLQPDPPAPVDPALSGQYAATLTEPDGFDIRGRPEGGSSTYATGASPNGQWLGGAQYFRDGGLSGIVFAPDRSMYLTGSFTPYAFTNDGVAVGADGSTGAPAIWTAEKGVQPLPPVPVESYLFATAHIVTSTGLIEVNVATNPADPNITRQFIFNGRQYEELEQPGDQSSVYHVNDNGWATGSVFPAGQDSSAAYRIASLWIDGRRFDVNDLFTGHDGIHLETAEALNNRGQFVASGYDSDGYVAAYLLTPIVPEPTAIALILASVPLSRRRRR